MEGVTQRTLGTHLNTHPPLWLSCLEQTVVSLRNGSPSRAEPRGLPSSTPFVWRQLNDSDLPRSRAAPLLFHLLVVRSRILC